MTTRSDLRPLRHRRMPAEWEPHRAVLMSWPHADTDWAPILTEARSQFARVARAIAAHERVVVCTPDVASAAADLSDLDPERLTLVECPTDDTWARDFGPITVQTPARGLVMLHCKFNGWGLKFPASRDCVATRRLWEQRALGPYALLNRLSFVLEGGSIDSDGQGTLLTTSQCLLSPQRNGQWTRRQIQAWLRLQLGARRVIWLDHGGISGDDTDSHVDTLARFTSPGTIAYVAPPADPADPDHHGLSLMQEQLRHTGLRCVALPYAGPVSDPATGERLPATYANFLIVPGAVLMPTYGLDTDAEAARTLQTLFPDREVTPVDCSTLIRQHGSLHCVTMQLF